MAEHVLVVEDNAALAANVAEMLREEGIDVSLAHSTHSALEVARTRGFDLAIVDIGLSEAGGGLDLVPVLRDHSPHGEIVLMTGNATLDSAIMAIRRGVYAYLPKPFKPEHLIALSKRALSQVSLKNERQALAQRLAASEALYRGVVESVEACILGIDTQGFIRFANRFASDRLGSKDGDLVGLSLLELVVDASERKTLADAVARVRHGEAVRDREYSLQASAGESRRIRLTLTPLDMSALEGAVSTAQNLTGLSILAAGIDITERLELERRNAEAEAMAAMGTLTTGLAHEIRNPLNAAKLQLELLLRRGKRMAPSESREALLDPAVLVRSELARLSTLLDDFLDLARPRRLERRECSVAQLFDAVLRLEGPVAAEARVTLSARVDPPTLTMRADADKLTQVLLNLIGNALDALRDHPQGKIDLDAKATSDGGVVILVTDNGPGIDPAVSETAFKPFVTSKQGGTGLGLAIVQKIVVQHGGEASLKPGPEGGTVAGFTVGP